jgi:hypothetical protein
MNRLLPAEAGLRRLERLGLRWRALANQGFVESRRGPRPGSSRELLGIRAWEVGDDWRDLDWAVTARFGRPHVRVYERSVEATLVLLLDASASMSFGSPSRFEYAHALAQLTIPNFPVPMGILYRQDKPTYGQLASGQVQEAIEKQGPGDLNKLLYSGMVWEVGADGTRH